MSRGGSVKVSLRTLAAVSAKIAGQRGIRIFYFSRRDQSRGAGYPDVIAFS
jgi:hypothetical protein